MKISFNRNHRIAFVLLASYWIVMIIGTHLPVRFFPAGFRWSDKLYHFLEYVGLAVLLVNVFALGFRSVRRVEPRALIVIGLLLASFGAVDEVTQVFSPGRQPSLGDWTADCLGIVLGITLCAIWKVRFYRAARQRYLGEFRFRAMH